MTPSCSARVTAPTVTNKLHKKFPSAFCGRREFFRLLCVLVQHLREYLGGHNAHLAVDLLAVLEKEWAILLKIN